MMPGTQTKFWLVWHFGGRPSTMPHWTKESAQTEAQRLASNCPGETFTVMACVGAYQSEVTPVAPVRVVKRPPTDEDHTSEIPF